MIVSQLSMIVPDHSSQRELAVLEERNRLAGPTTKKEEGKWERVITYLGELSETSQQAFRRLAPRLAVLAQAHFNPQLGVPPLRFLPPLQTNRQELKSG